MFAEWTAPLRRWQADALKDFQKQTVERRNYLLVATPGSGKTRLALRIAHWLFQRGQVERLIVVTPTSHLRRQWADEAARLAGLQLDPNWQGTAVHESMQGLALTYQMVAYGSNCNYQRHMVSQKRTLVILDEIHHAGEQRSWGDAVQRAYELAECRLLLSGTPFRSDNFPIAFVAYDPDTRECVPDAAYSYGVGIRDNVCREVYFPSFDGRIEYVDRGEIKAVSFRDEMAEDEANKRLKMALQTEGDWLKQVLTDANSELLRIRQDQPDAAGLAIAIDQRHACDVAQLLERVTGTYPVIAISDDPNSSDHITSFRDSKAPWLVAVKMVSEGVDIPRLRVGVYATNVTSEVFFRQALGRLVRMQPEYDDQDAYLYIPEDVRLLAYAQQIKEERQHAIEDMDDDPLRESREPYEGDGEHTLSLIESNALEGSTVHDGILFSPSELDRARKLALEAGVRLQGHRVDDVTVAKILRLVSPMGDGAGVVPTHDAPALYMRHESLRRKINRLARRLAHLTKRPVKEIHNDLHFIDNKWAATRTEKEMLECIVYLEQQIDMTQQQGVPSG